MNTNELVIREWIETALDDLGSASVLAKVPYLYAGKLSLSTSCRMKSLTLFAVAAYS
ncbi:MAG: hypothetical protein LBI42_14395 [Chitinispirillales bacterium]|jgi:hypothetical protein|nr:hypothetical protein [Chitinispirillales bacterium]